MNRPPARLLAQIAHDLRSPLNVIGSTLNELCEVPAPTEADRAQILSLSQRAVSRLTGLADRLALAAQLEGPLVVTKVPLDLGELTRRTLEPFLAASQRKRVEVITVFPKAPAPVSGDAALLTALLLELLSNGNRFARRTLRIEVCCSESVALLVDDDGPGVPPAEQSLLFEPFAERQNHTGLGMGLWLARRVAELHEGSVTVEPRMSGTRQQLVLPRRP